MAGKVHNFSKVHFPHQFIKRSFDSIMSQATAPLLAACAYMDRQWIASKVHHPENWSVFLLTEVWKQFEDYELNIHQLLINCAEIMQKVTTF